MKKKFRTFVNNKMYIQEYCGSFCYFICYASPSTLDALSLEEVFVRAIEGRGILHQWMGLYDSEGKEIYEGDILKYDEYESEFNTVLVKETDEFHLNHPGWVVTDNWCQRGKPKIIGNIVENPDLLN